MRWKLCLEIGSKKSENIWIDPVSSENIWKVPIKKRSVVPLRSSSTTQDRVLVYVSTVVPSLLRHERWSSDHQYGMKMGAHISRLMLQILLGIYVYRRDPVVWVSLVVNSSSKLYVDNSIELD